MLKVKSMTFGNVTRFFAPIGRLTSPMGRLPRFSLMLVLALTFLLSPMGTVWAQSYVNAQRFEPSIHTFGQFRLESAKVTRGMRPSFFVVFNHVGEPWVPEFTAYSGNTPIDDGGTFLEQLGTLNIVGAFAFLDYGSLGFDMPLHLYRSGKLRGENVEGFSTGDLRISLKGTFLPPRISRLGAAIAVEFGVPTGKDGMFTDEAAFYMEEKLLLEGRSKGARLLYNLGIRHRFHDFDKDANALLQPDGNGVVYQTPLFWDFTDPTVSNSLTLAPVANERLKEELRHALGIGIYPQAAEGMVEIIIEGAMGTSLRRPFEKSTTYLESTAGVKLNHTNGFMLGLGAGVAFMSGYGNPKYRVFASVGYQPQEYRPEDTDGDGLVDDKDQCPKEPEDFDAFQDEDGCPEPDNDQDEILDVDDKCPLDPEDYDGVADEDGCPDGDKDGDGIDDAIDKCPDKPEDIDGFQDQDGCPDADSDGDGIDDPADNCPKDAEDKDGFQDADGCPDLDNDEDGVPDRADKCPNDPEDKDNIADQDGCPEQDADNDGVLDAQDGCPLEPENINGCEDTDGCPEAKKVCVTSKKIVITEKIFFATNRARILKKSHDLLEEVAQVILNHSEIELIEIQGHTDSRGSDSYNRKLSEKRAKAVHRFLSRLGVPRGRIQYQGYGEEQPIADNETDEGRAKNRRVEFIILRQRTE
ncbi:MAG: flagellar motor protein MotB [Myxococcales bacterium]|nr:flagellar motor protein MotB [Myxococcales bacterium]